MPLAAGDKLGPYEVLSPIGAGGMGEVYKARDTRLDRTVAIKVLPEHIAKREDLRARFEREAREHYLAAGFSEYLSKPIKPEALYALIESLVHPMRGRRLRKRIGYASDSNPR